MSGIPMAQATVDVALGDRYTGGFKGNHMDGKGEMNYSDDSTYEGDWKVGKRHGSGTLTM